MKLCLNVVGILVFSILFASAQEPQTHPMKMFTDTDGKLYINKTQPMYLFLGTSADPTQVEKLPSQSTPKYANPFYFDTEGRNTIRTPSQVDPVTKKAVVPEADIIFDVYADGLAPSTGVKFSNASKYIKESKIIYGKGLGISLNAGDQVSGVDQVFYSIDGAPYKKYEDTIRLNVEKDYSLKYYSVDRVGNVELPKIREFTLDVTAPVVAWKLLGDVADKNALSGRSKIELLAKDEISGVKKIFYQIDEGPLKTYLSPIPLNEIPDGDHAFKFFADDNVSNTSKGGDLDNGLSIHAFIVDKTPPTASIELEGDVYNGQYTYVSPRTKVKLSGEDDLFGIKKINYSINSTSLEEQYGEPFNLLDQEGFQAIRAQSWDYVANKSLMQKKTVFYDKEAPVSGIQYLSPKFFARDTLFISESTSISLFSKDAAAGVQKIEYKVDNGGYVEGKQLKLTGSGLHKIAFKAYDHVNNEELFKTSEVVVDIDGPEVYVNFSIKSIRQEVVDGETIEVYPPYVNMYIGATDRYCGTQSIFYTIDGGVKRDYAVGSNPSDVQMFTKEKMYSVLVEAVDKLGNKGTKTVRFKIASK